jgi:hypothetical protein
MLVFANRLPINWYQAFVFQSMTVDSHKGQAFTKTVLSPKKKHIAPFSLNEKKSCPW